MSFKEKYTTEAVKSALSTSDSATPEQIATENRKTVISDDAYSNNEVIESLINAINRASRRHL